MKTTTFELPAMYGDHHVLEVRRLLLGTEGVTDVYASSAFRSVEVQYDDSIVSPDALEQQLDQAGYLGELPVPVETGIEERDENGAGAYFRHTVAHEKTTQVVSFVQSVPYAGRPLWPCPGMGPLTAAPVEEEEA